MNPIVLLPRPGAHADIESLATVAGHSPALLARDLRAHGSLAVTPRDPEHEESIRASAERFGFLPVTDQHTRAEEGPSPLRTPAGAGEERADALDAAALWSATAAERTGRSLHEDMAKVMHPTAGDPLQGAGTQEDACALETATPSAFELPEVGLHETPGIAETRHQVDSGQIMGWPRSLIAFGVVSSFIVIVAVVALLSPSDREATPAGSSEQVSSAGTDEAEPARAVSDDRARPSEQGETTAPPEARQPQPRDGTNSRRPRTHAQENPLVSGLVAEGNEACDERDWDRCMRLADRALQIDEGSRPAMALRIRAMAGQSDDFQLNDAPGQETRQDDGAAE